MTDGNSSGLLNRSSETIDRDEEAQRVSQWEGFLSIQTTRTFQQLVSRPEKFIAFFTGNQWGKNANIVRHYVLRWLGKHQVEEKNLRPWTKIRTYRFCSENLPGETDEQGASKNTIYPYVKMMLPKAMIKRDITQRSSIMTIADYQGGPDFYIEFVSYSQVLQSQAGVQRASVYIDENCPKAFMEEQLPRLLVSDGDIIVGMTPALGQVTWQFEEIFEKAQTVIRTPLVRQRLKERFNEDVPEIQTTEYDSDICVFMAATDDNPFFDTLVANKNKDERNRIARNQHPVYKTLADFVPITKAEYIRHKFGLLDEETEDVRRFGIFRQVSGRIFKDFDASLHVISREKYFPEKLPAGWVHARGIDYHKHVDWHVGWIALSPENEAFIYEELVVSPEKFVTRQIARMIADRSLDYKFSLNLIDPLSKEMQVNTGISSLDDMNHLFSEFRREGRGTGGWWTPWDTKSTRGREEIRTRLKNARTCGRPFNNRQLVLGREVRLPTLWVLSNCRTSIDYFKNWRLEEWVNRTRLETKEMKESPMQRYSHMNMVWEAVFKEAGFKPKPLRAPENPRHTVANYGRRF